MADRKRKSPLPAVAAAQTVEEKAAQAERELSEAEKKLLAQLRTRSVARPQAPRVKVQHKPPGPMTLAADGGELGHTLALLSSFATTSIEFQTRTLHELLEASCRGGNRIAFEEWDVNGALAALHGIAPRDETEALLATQMVAVHSAAMRCLRQLKGSETIPQQDSNGRLAVKLLFAAAAARAQAVVPETLEPSVMLKPMTAGREVTEDYNHVSMTRR